MANIGSTKTAEKQISALEDTASAHVFHPLFNSPDADVILISSDTTRYRVHSFILRNTCTYFRTLPALVQRQQQQQQQRNQQAATSPTSPTAVSTIPPLPPLVIDVSEEDRVLTKVLSMLCGLYTEAWESIEDAEDALSLISKWDAPGPLSVIRTAITAPLFLASPIRLYAMATTFGWDEEAQLAATRTLPLDLYDEEYKPDLERIRSKHLLRLLRLHRSRRDEFKRSLDSDEMFEAGNSPRYMCNGCGEQLSNQTWRELKIRMFMEMDKRPAGDTLCGLDMEEWPEAVACWEACCTKPGCGRLNYSKLETLRDIKKCVERLPTQL
ncbi:hypothetical protein CVT24_005067 [Panaeolus cyanescens]|uniref:BTB domain-containing protein n=1 Tax=Panaeolus cyanescens TaxID=181874 RepID=A0A409VPN0_9AGAR|nr:hypothetical protein CVT24_005067 [Panaeolus cyanescens]